MLRALPIAISLLAMLRSSAQASPEPHRIGDPSRAVAHLGFGGDLFRDLLTLFGRSTRLADDVCTMSSPHTATPPPFERVPVIARRKKAWEQALGGEAAAKPYIQARLNGWPQRVTVDRASLPASETDFLWRLARDTWRGLDALRDRENGLPINTVRFNTSGDTAGAHIGDYAGGTDIGLHLIAIVAASDLGLMTTTDAMEHARRVLDTVDRLERYRGFLFNYYDTTSLERTSNFVSSLDSSWLIAGLIVTRGALPELAEHCTRLIDGMNYRFFYRRATRQLSHGYYVEPGVRSPYDYGLLYTEARLASLIAIGKGDIPADHWFALWRTLPAACNWQTQSPRDRRGKTVDSHEIRGGYYEWRAHRYVPSWGGSMFEALMPTLVLDERRYAPKSLGANDAAHARVQQRFALDVLGYPVWGISPSATSAGDSYGEHGVPILGVRGYATGPVTPHASALALSVTPEAARANLRQLAERYPTYSEYGFYDAVDPLSGRVAPTYLALDQSMLFIALANHLGDGVIQRRFAADPLIQRVLPLIGVEDFFN
jgi:hypothetical protein